MPASRILGLLVIVLAVASLASALPRTSLKRDQVSAILSTSDESSNLGAALNWLVSNQSATGSYGAYQEHMTAAAAYALWLNDSHSPNAALSYSWLASQMNSSSSWFWGAYGEADVPGATLYSIASSSNIPLINGTFVKNSLLQLQLSNGGFEGYYDSKLGQTVTSSVDTDMALLGLISAKSIPATNVTMAVSYLDSLQNPDGSFNLTKTVSSDPIYSLGPDPVSITAMTVLALKSAVYPGTESHVSTALTFLRNSAASGFHGKGHVYSAAVTTLALKEYSELDSVVASVIFLLSQQNCDGGFSDLSRSSYPQSNALDTSWVVAALETQSQGTGSVPANGPRVNCAPVAAFSFSPQTPTAGVAVHFDAIASHDPDADRLSYNWTFGDGSNAQGVNVVHTYTGAGSFTVTLVVSDSGTNPGPLSNTKLQSITVQPIQQSPISPPPVPWLILIGGVVAIIAAVGLGFLLGRRTGGRRSTILS